MITGKSLLRLASVVAVICMLFACVSCGKASGDRDDAFDILSSMGSQNAVKHYEIVLAHDCSPDVAQRAAELAEKISERTGVKCSVIFDTDMPTERERCVRILIGNTNRKETSEIFESIKADDYVCMMLDSTIVIGGYSDKATLAALERFMSEILPNASAGALMSGADGFIYKQHYELDEILLCGFNIGAYRIVCDEHTYEYAVLLRRLISDKCGVFLDIVKGEPSESVREIVISADNASGNIASIGRNKGDVTLTAGDTYGISLALGHLLKLVTDNADGPSSRVDISTGIVLPYASPDLKVMLADLETDGTENDLARIFELARRIKASSAEITALTSVSAAALDVLMSELGTPYTLRTHDNVAVILSGTDVGVADCAFSKDNGMYSYRLRAERISSGEEYDIMLVDAREANEALFESTVKGYFEGCRETVALWIPSSAADVLTEFSASAELSCSAIFDVSGGRYISSVLSKDARTSVSEGSVNVSVVGRSVYVEMTVDKKYAPWCSEYLKDIYN